MFWKSTAGVLLLTVALTAVALLENGILPWSPFYVLYMLAATLVPIRIGLVWGERRRRPMLVAVAIGLVCQLIGAGAWFGALVPALLDAAGVATVAQQQPFYSFPAALTALFERLGERWNADPSMLQVTYLTMIVLWAGFGEEVFYRGYVHERLRAPIGVAGAALVSSLFFAVRHATQLALLGADYPWVASAAWVGFSFGLGFVFVALYERWGLWAAVVAHYVFNLVPFAALLAA